MTGAPLLSVRHLTRTFGGIRAVDDVSFDMPAGSVFGVIGPNGAGKTTVINLLTGLARPSSGQVLFRNRQVAGLPAHRIARLGMARTYQNIKLFRSLTAWENVVIGQHSVTHSTLLGALFFSPVSRREDLETRQRSYELLSLVGLAGKEGVPAGSLSYGDQRRLEIARALAASPALLLLDEPAAGMNHAEVNQLGQLIRQLKLAGHAILLVEHHMGLVMSVCERLVVLSFGVKIAEGTPEQLAADPVVVEAYLGRE